MFSSGQGFRGDSHRRSSRSDDKLKDWDDIDDISTSLDSTLRDETTMNSREKSNPQRTKLADWSDFDDIPVKDDSDRDETNMSDDSPFLRRKNDNPRGPSPSNVKSKYSSGFSQRRAQPHDYVSGLKDISKLEDISIDMSESQSNTQRDQLNSPSSPKTDDETPHSDPDSPKQQSKDDFPHVETQSSTKRSSHFSSDKDMSNPYLSDSDETPQKPARPTNNRPKMHTEFSDSDNSDFDSDTITPIKNAKIPPSNTKSSQNQLDPTQDSSIQSQSQTKNTREDTKHTAVTSISSSQFTTTAPSLPHHSVDPEPTFLDETFGEEGIKQAESSKEKYYSTAPSELKKNPSQEESNDSSTEEGYPQETHGQHFSFSQDPISGATFSSVDRVLRDAAELDRTESDSSSFRKTGISTMGSSDHRNNLRSLRDILDEVSEDEKSESHHEKMDTHRSGEKSEGEKDTEADDEAEDSIHSKRSRHSSGPASPPHSPEPQTPSSFHKPASPASHTSSHRSSHRVSPKSQKTSPPKPINRPSYYLDDDEIPTPPQQRLENYQNHESAKNWRDITVTPPSSKLSMNNKFPDSIPTEKPKQPDHKPTKIPSLTSSSKNSTKSSSNSKGRAVLRRGKSKTRVPSPKAKHHFVDLGVSDDYDMSVRRQDDTPQSGQSARSNDSETSEETPDKVETRQNEEDDAGSVDPLMETMATLEEENQRLKSQLIEILEKTDKSSPTKSPPRSGLRETEDSRTKGKDDTIASSRTGQDKSGDNSNLVAQISELQKKCARLEAELESERKEKEELDRLRKQENEENAALRKKLLDLEEDERKAGILNKVRGRKKQFGDDTITARLNNLTDDEVQELRKQMKGEGFLVDQFQRQIESLTAENNQLKSEKGLAIKKAGSDSQPVGGTGGRMGIEMATAIEKIKDLEKRIADMQNQEALRRAIEDEKYQEKEDRLQAELEKEKKKSKETQDKLDTALNEMVTLESQWVVTENQLVEKDNELAKLQDENIKLREQARSGQLSRPDTSAKHEVGELMKQMKEKDYLNDRLQMELDELRMDRIPKIGDSSKDKQELSELRERVRNQEKQITTLNRENEDLNELLEEHRNSSALSKQQKGAERGKEWSQTDFDAQIEKIQKEADRKIETQSEIHHKDRLRWEEKMNSLNNDMMKQAEQNELDQKTLIRKHEKEKEEERRIYAKRIIELENQLTAQQKEQGDTKATPKAKGKSKQLTQTNRFGFAQKAPLKRDQKKVDTSKEDKVNEKMNEILNEIKRDFDSEIHQKDLQQEEFLSLQQKVSELAQKLNEADAEKEALSSQISDLQKEQEEKDGMIRELNQMLALPDSKFVGGGFNPSVIPSIVPHAQNHNRIEMESQIDDLEGVITRLRQKEARMNGDLQMERERNEKLVNDNNRLNHVVIELRQDRDQLSVRSTQFEKAHDESLQELIRLRQTVKLSESSRVALEEAISEQSRISEDQQRRLRELKDSQITHLKNEIQILMDERKMLGGDREEMQKNRVRINDLARQLDAKDEVIATLELKVKEIESKNGMALKVKQLTDKIVEMERSNQEKDRARDQEVMNIRKEKIAAVEEISSRFAAVIKAKDEEIIVLQQQKAEDADGFYHSEASPAIQRVMRNQRQEAIQPVENDMTWGFNRQTSNPLFDISFEDLLKNDNVPAKPRKTKERKQAVESQVKTDPNKWTAESDDQIFQDLLRARSELDRDRTIDDPLPHRREDPITSLSDHSPPFTSPFAAPSQPSGHEVGVRRTSPAPTSQEIHSFPLSLDPSLYTSKGDLQKPKKLGSDKSSQPSSNIQQKAVRNIQSKLAKPKPVSVRASVSPPPISAARKPSPSPPKKQCEEPEQNIFFLIKLNRLLGESKSVEYSNAMGRIVASHPGVIHKLYQIAYDGYALALQVFLIIADCEACVKHIMKTKLVSFLIDLIMKSNHPFIPIISLHILALLAQHADNLFTTPLLECCLACLKMEIPACSPSKTPDTWKFPKHLVGDDEEIDPVSVPNAAICHTALNLLSHHIPSGTSSLTMSNTPSGGIGSHSSGHSHTPLSSLSSLSIHSSLWTSLILTLKQLTAQTSLPVPVRRTAHTILVSTQQIEFIQLMYNHGKR
ncbi:hypothetical protein BLNAU_4489 [Blattamonas nauphoetae]|uniref:Uncharacterized protein n=1 Tax=Blattamonas nauphoetae TaxID=2049346 RepID=A0ABQ9YA72_9EUKA|nr:hypothetical protein BLNAU_4489 [Blattamonas nauphoetae]